MDMTETGQPSRASAALSSASLGTVSPMTSASPSSAIWNTSGQVSTQSPQEMQPLLSMIAFIKIFLSRETLFLPIQYFLSRGIHSDDITYVNIIPNETPTVERMEQINSNAACGVLPNTWNVFSFITLRAEPRCFPNINLLTKEIFPS